RTARLVVGAEHEVVDQELRSPPEQIRQRDAAFIGVEAVVLFDPDPGQCRAPPRQLVAAPRQLLLRFEQIEPRRQPFFACCGRVCRRRVCHRHCLCRHRSSLLAFAICLVRVATHWFVAVRLIRTGASNGGSDKCGGIRMDSLITAAARALAAGDPLGALNRIALRDDAPALALRGIAMAQLGDLVRAKALVKRAARTFGPREAVARARCVVAEAEIALASRELLWPAKLLDASRITLEAHGDRVNAAHARYLEVRRLLM